MNARLIQGVALVIMGGCATACGALLPSILDRSETAGLRYTDVSVEGAPPFVALGTAIGALRGLIVDYLWIKVHMMKEKGLYYEVMADAELITKLQPRFAAVWAFHGHNMAYNISVACNTEEERWEWVNAGIRLVRNEGLRYNPNDLELHKELAFWFSHKIEGVSDDAHLYYKRMFCQEWHFVLGPPPDDEQERIAWIKAIADAPDTLEAAERRTPGVRALIERMDAALVPFDTALKFEPNRAFLTSYGLWKAVNDQSAAAEILGARKSFQKDSPFFAAFDEIASDPEAAAAWETLLAFVRKRVLIDEYNMEPDRMYRYTRDYGPIDWRNGQAHALYWSMRGSEVGESREKNEDDIYKIVNNDRLQLQAMQDLARYGRITFDPFSTELPSRFPDPRWIDTIDKMFVHMYEKHYKTRGAGGETFIAFLQNFMSSSVRQAYRSGEIDRAQQLLDRLDEKFGSGAKEGLKDARFMVPLDVFVKNEVEGQYQAQPYMALNESVAALRYGFRVGIGRDRPDVYRNALKFVDQVIAYFKGNEYNDYVTRYGEGRMKDLIGGLEQTRRTAFAQLMTDPLVSMQERATLWAKVDRFEPRLRLEVYDMMAPSLQSQFARHELSAKYAFADLFPEPPGLDVFRVQLAREMEARQKQEEETRARDEMLRK